MKNQAKIFLLITTIIASFGMFTQTASAQTSPPLEVKCASWDTELTWAEFEQGGYKAVKFESWTKESEKEFRNNIKNGTVKLIKKSLVAAATGTYGCLNGSDATYGALDEGEATFSSAELRPTAVRVLQYFLGFLAILGVAFVLYGGVVWITSSGSEDKVGKARKIIIAAAIGLIIITVAWTIVSFVVNTAKDNIT